jgi:hypothetical protein
MVLLITFLVTVFVSNAFFTFDEEMLIIVATLFWFDAAGGLFKKMLESELVVKVDVVRSKFIWFLTLKHQLLEDLLKFHTSRISLGSALSLTNSVFLTLAVTEVVALYLATVTLRRKFVVSTWISLVGAGVYYGRLLSDLEQTLTLSSFSGVAVSPSVAEKPLFDFDRYSSFSGLTA